VTDSRDPLRLGIIADGDPRDQSTNSGVARALQESLAAREGVEVSALYSGELRAALNALVRVLSFRPHRREWQIQSWWGRARPLIRSLKRSALIYQGRRGFDVLLHVRNFYYPTRHPYAVFIDTTLSIRARDWPEPGVSSKVYDRLIRVERRFYLKALRVFTASDYVAREVSRTYGVPAARVTVAGAGPIIRSTESTRISGPLAGRPLRVLFVGRDFERKGGDVLLAALEIAGRTASFSLDIVGCSPDVPPPLASVVRVHGDVLDAEMVARMYREADVFCLPARFEPFGIAAIEAMMHGLPCVVTDVGVLGDLMRASGAGLVVTTGDTMGLARALMVVHSDAVRAEMARRARENGLAYSWDRVAAVIALNLSKDLERK
jgi:glycosyltransferase involved in cell wall biosynthesis